jgi:hypothetical protein
MNLEKLLAQKKTTFLRRWFDLIIDSYPHESAQMFKREKNAFANPVGNNTYQGLEGVYNEFLQGFNPEKITPWLDKIIRIRAIQNFSPSQAITFVFQLKNLINEELHKEIQEGLVSPEELAHFSARIDNLALLAFDIYVECREKIYEIRINEVHNRTHRLLQRANLISESTEQGSELGDGNSLKTTQEKRYQ